MKRLGLAAAALAAAAAALAQEMVTIPTRPGVTQSFVVVGMENAKPAAVALLYVGGPGAIRLRVEEGQVTFSDSNFLPRSRHEFIRNGVLPVVMDAPSDQPGSLADDYRTGSEQGADARAVLAELKKRFPGLPVFLVGTSRGTLSAAYVGRALGDEVAGVVLTSTHLATRVRRAYFATLRGFDFAAIKAPLLFVHHREDACEFTPYSAAAGLGASYPLITVNGGKPAESGPCLPLSAHGFFGREAQTVDAIAGWMLGKPFARNIE